MFANAVYFPSHHIYRGDTPGQMNYNCISHVFYAHAQISTDGSVLVSLLGYGGYPNTTACLPCMSDIEGRG